MRPELHLPVLGHAFRASGVMACSSFGGLRCDTSIYSRAARYKPIDTSEAAEAAREMYLLAASPSGRALHQVAARGHLVKRLRGTFLLKRFDFREAFPYADQCVCRTMLTQAALLPRLRRNSAPTRTPSAFNSAEAFPRFRTPGCCYRPLRRVVPCVLAARLGLLSFVRYEVSSPWPS